VGLRHCDFYARVHLIKSPDKAKVSGIEAVAGRNAYVVEYSPDEYSKGRYYFDCENGLLVRQDEIESMPEGQLVQQDFPEDYRTVDGVKIQFRNRDILNGHTILLRLTQINHNVPVDDALFVKPQNRSNIVFGTGFLRDLGSICGYESSSCTLMAALCRAAVQADQVKAILPPRSPSDITTRGWDRAKNSLRLPSSEQTHSIPFWSRSVRRRYARRNDRKLTYS